MMTMKQRKHFSVLLLTFALFFLMTALCVSADAGGKPTKITAKSSKTLTVAQGSTFELKVRMKPGNADDDYLTWSIISGKSVVQFRDSDRNDDDIKLKAIKTGTAKVRCKIRGTNKKVTFTIKVKKASSA